MEELPKAKTSQDRHEILSRLRDRQALPNLGFFR